MPSGLRMCIFLSQDLYTSLWNCCAKSLFLKPRFFHFSWISSLVFDGNFLFKSCWLLFEKLLVMVLIKILSNRFNSVLLRSPETIRSQSSGLAISFWGMGISVISSICFLWLLTAAAWPSWLTTLRRSMCKSRQVGGEGSLAGNLKCFAWKIDPSSLASEYFLISSWLGLVQVFFKFCVKNFLRKVECLAEKMIGWWLIFLLQRFRQR